MFKFKKEIYLKMFEYLAVLFLFKSYNWYMNEIEFEWTQKGSKYWLNIFSFFLCWKMYLHRFD